MPSKLSGFILIIVLISHPSFGASSYYSDIQILSSGNSGISFRLNVAEPSKYVVTTSDGSGSYLIKSVLIGIPINTTPFISDAGGMRCGNCENAELGELRSVGNSMAEIIQTKTIRGKKVATIAVHISYQGAIYNQIDVAVDFQASGTAEGSDSYGTDKVFDNIFGYSILNYDQFKTWSSVSRRQILNKAADDPFSLNAVWYKLPVSVEGLTKVTGQNLIAVGLGSASIASDSLHLFYGGGKPLPVPNDLSEPSLTEIPITVVDGGDGRFNSSDYFFFYGEAANRWRYPVDSAPIYLENPYTSSNCYWLAVSGGFGQGGLRVDERDGTPSETADTTITGTTYYSRQETNKLLMHDNEGTISDYYTWYWSDQSQFTFYAPLSNLISGQSASVRIRAKAGGVSLSVNDVMASSVTSNSPNYYFETDRLFTGLNKVTLAMSASSVYPAHFDFCEISYQRNLAYSGEPFDFVINSNHGSGKIVIDNSSSDAPYIFDLTDSNQPIRITGDSVSTDEIIFNSELEPGRFNRFYLCPPGKMNTISGIEKVTLTDLRSNYSQTDMIIIAPEEFLSALEDYRDYRSATSGINVSLVSLEDIIDQFSFGLYDPTAIRNFLKFAYENYPSPPPSAVLLVGDGNYDFKNYLLTASQNLVPPYIFAYDSTASDDNYVYFGKYGLLDGDTTFTMDRGYDMMIARWSVRTLSELRNAIAKAESYEASTNFGPWRTTVTLVADDEFGAFDTESFHVRQTENLQKYHLPAAFRRNKIYLWDYPFDSNQEKSGVNEAVISSFNDGSLMINYVGHGNPDTWAHEHVFNRNSDIPRLNNSDRLAFVFSASCSNGFFDDPTREGMAEDLIRLPDGGAIATVSATRLVYAGENSEFNQQTFDILFGGDDLSLCQAVYTAKVIRQYSDPENPRPIGNDRAYAFFGDPFVKLGIPHYKIRFNNPPDSLLALARHSVSGEIVDKSDTSHVNFEGIIKIFVYDSEIEKTHKVVNGSGQTVDTIDYALAGPVIYRGTAVVSNGDFSFSFIAPLDIGYGGRGAKIAGYALSGGADAFGIADSIAVSAVISAGYDSLGPAIEYSFGGRENFLSGDKISSGDSLNLTLADSSGLNLMGGSGHGITLIIDNQVENSVDLTDLFEYNPGSFSTGKINYSPGKLTPGTHEFKIKVWDNANNSSVAEFAAEAVESGHLAIDDLMNYPNPMRGETRFFFTLTSAARRVSLEIFTVSGKRIKYVEKRSLPADYTEFCAWDGRDSDGDHVAAGVYIYKVTAVSELSDKTVESFGKIVVVN